MVIVANRLKGMIAGSGMSSISMYHISQGLFLVSSLTAMHHQNRGRGGYFGVFLKLQQSLTPQGCGEAPGRPFVNHGAVLVSVKMGKTTQYRQDVLTVVFQSDCELNWGA